MHRNKDVYQTILEHQQFLQQHRQRLAQMYINHVAYVAECDQALKTQQAQFNGVCTVRSIIAQRLRENQQ